MVDGRWRLGYNLTIKMGGSSLNRDLFYVDTKNWLVRLSALLMASAAVLLFLWCALYTEVLTWYDALARGLLPISAAVIYGVLLLSRGRRGMGGTFLPVLMGVVFFILKAGTFVWWHQLLCTILYLSVAVLYGLTVFGVIRTKILLLPLFGLPLAFHLFVQDMIIYRTEFTARQWLQESAVLCIMGSLLCASVAMKKKEAGHTGGRR